MFEPGKIYRHKNFKDVDVVVIKCEDREEKIKCRVDWISQTGKITFAQGDEIYVKKSDYKHWKEVSSHKH